MTPEQLEIYLKTLSPKDVMANLDSIAGMARRIRFKQGVGSPEDELMLCRVMLDLKFLTELVDALKNELGTFTSLRATYERMLAEHKQKIQDLTDGRTVQLSQTGA